jgi:peptide/nickel transport system substrate-binding protein
VTISRRTFLSGAALTGIAGALSACGVITGGAAHRGQNTLEVGIYRALGKFDPTQAGDSQVNEVVFETLVALDDHEQLIPNLARGWRKLDTTSWEIELRDNVTFSDGSQLTAESVVNYFDLLLADDSTLATSSRWRPDLDHAEVIDQHRLVIHTRYPYDGLIERLTSLFIAKPGRPDGPLYTRWIGTGPYVLESLNLDNGAESVRNRNYWQTAPVWERINFQVLATEDARITALQAHDVDLITMIDPTTIDQLNADPYYSTGIKPSTWFNILRTKETGKSPVKDVRVRRALNYATNKQEIIAGALNNSVPASPGQILVPDWETVNPSLQAFPHDPDKARDLLSQAGFGHETLHLRLDVPVGSYLAGEVVSQIIKSQWEQVDIDLELNTVPRASWLDLAANPDDGDLTYIGHSTPYRYTPDSLKPFESSYFQSHWVDKQYDGLSERAISAQSEGERQRYINEATQRFYDNPHGVLLFPQPVSWAVRHDLEWQPRRSGDLYPQTTRRKT